MAIRMTGLISGLDTDAVIKELMSAQSLKKTRIEQKKTKAEWKQEKWAELNKKVCALYNKQVSKMRLQGSYMTKKVTSSNESAVTAAAKSTAAAGSHTVEVTQLASSQYVTGAALGKDVTSKTKLTSLGEENNKIKEGTVITVKAGDKTKTLTVEADTTVDDFVKHLQSAGLNASFDESHGRFFISSRESGTENAFSITATSIAGDTELVAAKNELKTALGGDSSAIDSYYAALAVQKEKQETYNKLLADTTATEESKIAASDELEATKKAAEKIEQQLETSAKSVETKNQTALATTKVAEDYTAKISADTTSAEYIAVKETVDKEYYETDENGVQTFTQEIKDKAKDYLMEEAKAAAGEGATEDEINAKYEELVNAAGGEEAAINAKAETMYNNSLKEALKKAGTDYTKTDAGKADIQAIVDSESVQNAIAAAATKVDTYKVEVLASTAEVSDAMKSLGLMDITDLTAEGTTNGVSLVKAADAKVILDGAELTGSSNTFTAAGLTLELKNVTAGSKVTLNTTTDVDAVYEDIKDFFKEYNAILEEINTLYNAGSARGYEPLTDEEKEGMTEEQIELWETKIKDSLLRRDTQLGGLADAMRNVMQGTVEVDGKRYSLASFGITTSTDYTERGLLHIYGDEDDATYSGETDKLKAALTEDSDTVAKVLSGVISNLSTTLMDKMKKTSVSSSMTFYNDVEMKNQISDYEDEIEKWEDKLQDIEDRYYKQFAAMESAMAKMQSQSSYLSNLMGTA